MSSTSHGPRCTEDACQALLPSHSFPDCCARTILLCCSTGGQGHGWGDPCWKRKLRHTSETHPPFSDFSFFLEPVCGQGANRPVSELADGEERQANVATDATNQGGAKERHSCACVCAHVCARAYVHLSACVRACVCVSGRLAEAPVSGCPPRPLNCLASTALDSSMAFHWDAWASPEHHP